MTVAAIARTAGAGRGSRTGLRGRAKSRSGPGAVLAVPALVFFVAFAIVPLCGVAALSFAEWDGLNDPTWTGLDNWSRLLTDPVAGNALWLTVQVMVVSWLVQTPLSLLLGVFMAGKQRYRAVLSAFFFLPMLLSAAAIAITFKALLDPNFGLSRGLGIAALARDWLGDPTIALYVVLLVIAWQFIPFHSLLYQAGVRQIPKELYEAAQLDGAGRVKQFRFVTLPQLRYTVVTSSTLMLVGSLTYFDIIFVLTAGGPGYATRVLALDMYLSGFRSYDMGRASALALILVLAGLGISLGLSKLSGFSRMSSQMDGA